MKYLDPAGEPMGPEVGAAPLTHDEQSVLNMNEEEEERGFNMRHV